MKNITKLLLISVIGSAVVATASFAEPVFDWGDLGAVHRHIEEARNELGRAAAINNHDMGGHAGRAEALLKQADYELSLAIQSARMAP